MGTFLHGDSRRPLPCLLAVSRLSRLTASAPRASQAPAQENRDASSRPRLAFRRPPSAHIRAGTRRRRRGDGHRPVHGSVLAHLRQPGFNSSIDYIPATAGLRIPRTRQTRTDVPSSASRNRASRGAGTTRPARSRSPTAAKCCLSRERDRVSLCINSFSTPGGVAAPLVDVGDGSRRLQYEKDVKGAVVLGDADVGRLWQQAVKARGAIGVISTAHRAATSGPTMPKLFTSPDQQDVFQWGSVPYDAASRRSASRRAGAPRRACASG